MLYEAAALPVTFSFLPFGLPPTHQAARLCSYDHPFTLTMTCTLPLTSIYGEKEAGWGC